MLYGPSFSTYNETSDLIFSDVANGLAFGGPQTAGQAENAVLRCQFFRCGTGIQTVNWNSMDIWVWQGRFEDCDRGVRNVMGNWHVWQSLFLRSRIADLSSVNLMAFSAVNCDQPGGRIFADQLNANGPAEPEEDAAAVRVAGLRQTDVLFRALQGSGNGGAVAEFRRGAGK